MNQENATTPQSTTMDPNLTDTIGVNSEKLAKLKKEILDYGDAFNKRLQAIDDLIVGSKESFDCVSGDAFRDQFALLRDNFSIVSQNIQSYTEDYSNAELSYRNEVQNLVDLTDNYTKQRLDTMNEQYVEGKTKEE